MTSAMRALGAGLIAVLRQPALIVAATLAMFLASLPFGLILGLQVQDELAHQQPVSRGSSEIDPEWWQEFRERADGLAATFTPMILGFAAPLDNLSSLLDGTRRPLILLAPYALSIVVWAFLWGVALDRFAHGRQAGGFWRAGASTFVPFVAISAGAAVVVVLLYFTLHRVLFGIVAERLAASAATEQGAFAGRLALYFVFGAALALISLVAGYARVIVVVSGSKAFASAVAASTRFVRRHIGAVATLYLLTGALFVALLIAYGTLEAYGGSQVGGWRGVAIAQAYIIARLTIRLTFGASELRLFENLRARGVRSRSNA
jgi:hypothetical protein